MTEKRFTVVYNEQCKMMQYVDNQKEEPNRWAIWNVKETLQEMNGFADENEKLKKELKRCKDWINSDKNDYKLTLAFIKNKGYSLKDVLEYEKEIGK